MTPYVALLRAVNVGGTGKLPMADLAALCEAAGFALLERADRARRDSGSGHVALLGYGATSDGYHMSSPHPQGAGAVGAMRALREAGRRVPEQVSVVGLDNLDIAAFVAPPLTTVSQPTAHMATLGVELLLDLLAGREPEAERILIAPELVVRESTARL